jgi:hypothetical protein
LAKSAAFANLGDKNDGSTSDEVDAARQRLLRWILPNNNAQLGSTVMPIAVSCPFHRMMMKST